MGFIARWVYKMLLGVPQIKYFVVRKKKKRKLWGERLFACLIHPMAKKPIQISNSVCSEFPVK